jgi:hypothetical protein
MTPENLFGFDPAIHIAAPSQAVARVKSAHYRGLTLFLSEDGAAWARSLMEARPYFRRTWTLESKH